MGVDDLAEGQLAAHSEVGLVVREHGGRRSRGVHLAILLRLIQGPYELPYEGLIISNSTTGKTPVNEIHWGEDSRDEMQRCRYPQF